MVSLASRTALILAAVLASTWSVEHRGVRQDLGEGGSKSAAPGIHDLASSDMPAFRMMIGGSVIDVTFASGVLETPFAAGRNWISASAFSVTNYYARFPLKPL